MSEYESTLDCPVTRRTIMKAVAAAAAAAALTSPASSFAAADDDFSIVSRTLTDRADLDPVIRSALYQALTQLDGQFPAKLAKLKAFIQDYTATSGNLDALLKEQAKDLAPVAQQVATAWYLGIVGSGKTSKTITYANTLANAAVADVLTPPSYGFGEVNSWAAKPV